MLDPKTRKALQQALATANDLRPRLEYLETVATAYPELVARVKELRDKADFLTALSTTALEAERILASNGS